MKESIILPTVRSVEISGGFMHRLISLRNEWLAVLAIGVIATTADHTFTKGC